MGNGITFPFDTTVSSPPDGAAFSITNTSEGAAAVKGVSVNLQGIGISGQSDNTGGAGVQGESSVGVGVLGRCDSGTAVVGFSNTGFAMQGNSSHSIGVLGSGTTGVQGQDNASNAVGRLGCSDSDPRFHLHAGVYGESDSQGVIGLTTDPGGTGVFGGGTTNAADKQIGVRGETGSGRGVQGESIATHALGFLAGDHPIFHRHTGVYGESDNLGVSGQATADNATGVFGFSKGVSGSPDPRLPGEGVRGETHDGVGVQGQSLGSGLAGRFLGNVEITGTLNHHGPINCDGNITMTSPADVILSDFAEHFDLADVEIEPGTVVAIDENGALRPSNESYDKKVAGVVSGAGNFRPAIILGKQTRPDQRMPIALVGKVFCKVDADHSPVEIGDLLTTSDTLGHAMKAGDPLKAFGAVIGKALRPLTGGKGLIPILVALQ